MSASSANASARENARRAAQNLPPLKTAEELADAKFPDTVLDQAAEVMTDMVTGARPIHSAPGPHGAQREQESRLTSAGSRDSPRTGMVL